MAQKLVQKVPRPLSRHFVPLDKPPEPFVVPVDLRSRFRYDAAKRGLMFDGYMCKATFDRLRDVSYDFAYQRALEELFRKALPEDDPPQRGGYLSRLAIALLAVATLVAVGMKLARCW